MASPDVPSPNSAPPRKHSCLKAGALIGLIIIAVLLATSWLARGWLTSKAEAVLSTQLKKHNLHVEYSATEFSLRRQALVLENFTLFRDPAHSQPLLSISRVDAAFGLSASPSATIETDDATLSFDTGSSKPVFDSLDARIHLTAGAVKIEQFDALFQGLKVESSGDLAFAITKPKPSAPQEKSAQQEPPPKFDISKINLAPLEKLSAIVAIHSEHTPPKLALDFKSNLTTKSHTVSGKLSGSDFSYRDLAIEKIDIPFRYEGNPDQASISLQAATLHHQGRPVTLDGEFDVSSKTLRIDKFSSSADLLSLASRTSPKLANRLETFAFDPPPSITASGILPVTSPEDADLNLSIAGDNALKFAINGNALSLDRLAADLSLKNGLLKTDNLSGELFKGALTAKTSLRPFEHPLSLDTLTLNLEDASREYLESFLGHSKKMSGKFNVHFEGHGPPSLEGITGHARVEAFDANFYTIPIFGNLTAMLKKLIPSFSHEEKSTLSADIDFNQGTLTSNNIKVRSSGTTINATASVSLPKKYLTADANVRLGGDGIVGAATGLLGKALEVEAKGPFDHIKWRFKNVPGLNQFEGIAELSGKLSENTIGLLGGAAGKVIEAGKVPGEAVKEAAEAMKGLFQGLTPKKKK